MPKPFDDKKRLKLVSKANQFDRSILIIQDKKSINTKSILSASPLNGLEGKISLYAEGDNSERALETLKNICMECSFKNNDTFFAVFAKKTLLTSKYD
ncbi:HPr family phosphocarrier protein [Bacillus taeanensis]|uniref:HPr family phosphocarrier protein n=1 Tax=Bacillus taeanensis TaxID=273032 RepID=UPI0015F0F4F5|nr:HPr family phosphocarrier protein [Bacillus taeanensis]